MIIVTKREADPDMVSKTIDLLSGQGFRARTVQWNDRILVVTGKNPARDILDQLQKSAITHRLVAPHESAQLASKEFQNDGSIVKVGGEEIGATKIVTIAGPCSVESSEQVMETARAAKRAGASMLRGGVFKPRTSPYDFQGIGETGLQILAKAREETGLPVVTEVLDPSKVELASKYADMLQIGARNVQNFSLLRAVGKSGKPVLLKRGMMTTIDEWLQAAEYILLEGNPNVVLCERGIRTFEKATRNTLDLAAVPVLKNRTHLPVIVDPSHATGRTDLIAPMARAAIAAGADGLMIEVHPDPEKALSDSSQQLKPQDFAKLMEELEKVARSVGRTMR